MATKKTTKPITSAARDAAESEIKAKQKEVKYDLRDFTIDYIVTQFEADLFFVPDYQRKFVWRTDRQCKFVESVLLGLPIPMMFVADLDDGRLEIVDGVQRIRTLESFKNGDLKLAGLERLPKLNGFRFQDLPESQQRKFGTKALRLVILDDSTTPETRQEIFDRVNTSPLKATGSEVRRGAYLGKFMNFIRECASVGSFRSLCPMSKMVLARYEDEELVLRFFAYSDRYTRFKHDVERFLAEFLKSHQYDFNEEKMRREFLTMLRFVGTWFPNGFAKTAKSNSTPRVRFEAIAVGVNLALRENPKLSHPPVDSWIESEEFEKQTTTHASNSGPRLRGRLEFVRDKLLGK